jgi:hypothetical protein
LGNPLKYTDPSGHWTEEELEQFLGKEWYDAYFGQKGLFQDRSKLLDFLQSKNTTDLIELGVISQIMQTAKVAGGAGFSFNGIDAIGVRLAGSISGAAVASVSGDAILNLTSGEFSVFVSPGAGIFIGGGANVVGGLLVVANLPSNKDYRGMFGAAGIVGGDVVGLNAEAFWSSPLSDRFNAFDKAHGAFIGVTGGVELGGYVDMSYSVEVLTVDQSGTSFLNHLPSIPQVFSDVGQSLYHDILMHPIFPWSPYGYR